VPRGSQHSAAKRRKEKERQAKQAAKRERRLHKGEPGAAPPEDNDALVREYLGLPAEPEDESGEAEAEDGADAEGNAGTEGEGAKGEGSEGVEEKPQ
jgi:hypothetical protein